MGTALGSQEACAGWFGDGLRETLGPREFHAHASVCAGVHGASSRLSALCAWGVTDRLGVDEGLGGMFDHAMQALQAKACIL